MANRPNARVLVLTDHPEEYANAHGARLVHAAGDREEPGLWALTCSYASKRLQHLGAFDFVHVDDRYNMRPLPYHRIVETLQERNKACVVRVHHAEPPKLYEAVVDGWVCGVDRLGVETELLKPGQGCGHRNMNGHYFCRNCGGFRG